MKIITAPAIAAVLLLIVCVVHPVGADWVRVAVMEQDPQDDNNAPKEGTIASTWHDSFRQLFAPWLAKGQVVEHSEDAEFEVNNGEDNHDEEWLAAAAHYEDEEEPEVVMPRRGLAYGYNGRTYHSGYRNGGGRTSSYNGNGYSYSSGGGRGGGYGRSSYNGGYGRNSYDNDNYSDRYGDNDRYEYNGGRSSYHNGRYGGYGRGYTYDGYGRDNDRV